MVFCHGKTEHLFLRAIYYLVITDPEASKAAVFEYSCPSLDTQIVGSRTDSRERQIVHADWLLTTWLGASRLGRLSAQVTWGYWALFTVLQFYGGGDVVWEEGEIRSFGQEMLPGGVLGSPDIVLPTSPIGNALSTEM